jgi:hypothetical protein
MTEREAIGGQGKLEKSEESAGINRAAEELQLDSEHECQDAVLDRGHETKFNSEWWVNSRERKQALQQLLDDINLNDLLTQTVHRLEEVREQATRRTRWGYPLNTLLEVFAEYAVDMRVDFYTAVGKLHIAAPTDTNCYIVTDKPNDTADTSTVTYWTKIIPPKEDAMLDEKPYTVIHTSIRANIIRARVKELLGEWPESWSIVRGKSAVRERFDFVL